MPNKGLSQFLPDAVLNAYRPLLSVAVELAAAAYMVAVWLVVIGWLIVGFSVSFQNGVEGVFAGSSYAFALVPIVIVALTLATRMRGPASDARGRGLLDTALTLAFGLSLLFIVMGIVGFFASFGDNGFATVVADLLTHVADVVLGVLGVVWSLSEIAKLRQLPSPAS